MVCSQVQTNFDFEIHEQLYSWEPSEDIWGSLIDVEQTRRARTVLVEAFDPSLPVRERSIGHLEKSLLVLKEILDIPTATAWSECSQTDESSQETQNNLRANTILLLYRHLEWLWNIFRHVPGASVTVR